jgi:hypothetical protein
MATTLTLGAVRSLVMKRMLRTLQTHPEKGFMGGQAIRYRRGLGFIQYWRSFDEWERFARHPSEPHLATWRRANQAIGAAGTVGFWHETYLVEPGKYEAVYGNMPVFGLAAVPGMSPPPGGAKPPAAA